eukprot:3303264-Prymnesium_polylepis.1
MPRRQSREPARRMAPCNRRARIKGHNDIALAWPHGAPLCRDQRNGVVVACRSALGHPVRQG